jgi:TatD DNase family protein
MDLGCCFSVNQQILNSPNGRQFLLEVPDNRLLKETDGPFVAKDGKPIEPGDVQAIIDGIADLRGRTMEVVRWQIIDNLRQLVSE